MQDNHTLDNTDIDILRILYNDCRTSYRSIASSVGLSKNAIKTRVNRLISNGIIRGFLTTINPTIFGYSRVCYLTIKDNKKNGEKILNKLERLGKPIIKMDCIGGFSILALATKEQDLIKIQSLVETPGPAVVLNCIVGQYPVKYKLQETDFKMLKCLIADPRMQIFEIAKRISASSKTASKKFARMKENRIFNIILDTDPVKMPGYIVFGMIIRFEMKDYDKSIYQIHEELNRNFLIAFPRIVQKDIAFYQLVARSIFEIDPILKKVEKLEGVCGAEVFIPFRAPVYQDWMLREIDNKIKNKGHSFVLNGSGV
jgi:DNA-binding Lrp family transcriptional regulator